VAIYLEPGFQGKGLGRQSLSFVIKQAPGLQLHTLLGFVFAHNPRSMALFRQLGFETWGTLPAVADMAGKMRDLVIVGMKVGGDNGTSPATRSISDAG
jgi:phosphinothricin acetyltransferase